jgi:hypothetical protein
MGCGDFDPHSDSIDLQSRGITGVALTTMWVFKNYVNITMTKLTTTGAPIAQYNRVTHLQTVFRCKISHYFPARINKNSFNVQMKIMKLHVQYCLSS